MSTQSKLLVPAAALLCGLTLSSAAVAQEAGLYVIGSLGRSSANIDTSPLNAVGVTAITTDDNDFGWKVNLGYQINPNWGIEVGYSDFGVFALRGTSPLGGAVIANVDVSAWTLAVVGTIPFGNFSLMGKVGAARGKAEGSGTVDVTPVSFDDKGTDLFLGFGLRYDVNSKLGVQFDYENYYFDDRTHLYTLGLRYKF